MAWRFKASKYKNSAPIVPKLENQIRDLSIGTYLTHGNHIAASAAFMAFNWDSTGSNLAVLPIDTIGRQDKTKVPLVLAHSDIVTDFQFSPFDDGLLATGSQDLMIKLWRIPESGLTSNLSDPELVLEGQPRRIDVLSFHPTADCLLTSCSGRELKLWDLIEAKAKYTFHGHEDDIHSVSWRSSGQTVASQCRDRKLRIIDPRADATTLEIESHQGLKDSKVVWIGDTDRVLTSGFNKDGLRELSLRDLRNPKVSQKDITFPMSPGILVPLFDNDTNMCFLWAPGERNIQFVEVSDKDPFIIEGLRYSGEVTKGACLVPKRTMNVMQAEVNRVLQLCNSSVVPVTWQVPRKTYRDYHSEIFPDTVGLEAQMGPENWWKGENHKPLKISLDPKKRPKEKLTTFQDTLKSRTSYKEVAESRDGEPAKDHGTEKKPEAEKPKIETPQSKYRSSILPATRSIHSTTNFVKPEPKPRLRANKSVDETVNRPAFINDDPAEDPLAVLRRQPSIKDRKKMFEQSNNEINKANSAEPAPVERRHSKSSVFERAKQITTPDEPDKPTPKPRPVSKVFGRICKFKHMKGKPMHKKHHFENLRNLSRTTPSETNLFYANRTRLGVPLSGPGGKIAIFELTKSGRIPDGVMPVLINGTTVMDFCWDPFDDGRLFAACDDGVIRVWRVPEGGLTEPVNEPKEKILAHSDKIQIIKSHPLANNIVLTASFDRSVKVWNVTDFEEPKFELERHPEQVFSAEWSQSGRFIATVCKDGLIRIFDPRHSSEAIQAGGKIAPKKGARVVWVLDDECLVVTSFSRQSEQQVDIYTTKGLEKLNSIVLNVSPAILIPFYDADSNTLFLTGKGESCVSTYEVSHDPPHLHALSPYRPAGLHQGLSFLPKIACNVRDVEFARAYRLKMNAIEPISFTVPRVKSSYFQDDLFPPTRVLWESTMTAEEWTGGANKPAVRLDVRPPDMEVLSRNNGTSSNGRSSLKTVEEANGSGEKETKAIANDLQSSVSKMLKVNDELEQDQMEGAAEEDWEQDN